MLISHHKLSSHGSLDLSAEDGQALHVMEVSGRNVQIDIPAKWISLWLPLSGWIDIDTPQYGWTLPKGNLLVWRDQPLRAASGRPVWGFGICGSQAAWEAHLRGRPGHLRRRMDVFLSEDACPRSLRRLFVRLVRMSRQPASATASQAIAAFIAELFANQASLQALLPRCKGRTRQRQQQTLMRLLRVEHLIRKHEDTRLDLAYLAASANYSPCHLIRSYRDVFGETPAEYAGRLRAERAWRLVRDTSMPVCEITEALGFESQSAFCRAFKNSFGATATEVRRDHRPGPHPAYHRVGGVPRAA
jgi:AraC family transcriptional regulator